MDCQSGCVQSSLLMLVQSLLYGNQSSDASYSQEVLTIAQLIQFNTTNSKNSRHYHLKNNKPPLLVHIGLLIYSRTRKRDLIDAQYELGWSISYDRILKILDTTKNTICAQYLKDDAVCPPNLRNGQFTNICPKVIPMFYHSITLRTNHLFKLTKRSTLISQRIH